MKRLVMKFGGTSLANPDLIKRAGDLIKTEKEKGYSIVVVVSAMGATTDKLICLSEEISEKPNKREMDALLSTGEMVSASLLSIYLNSIGIESVSLNGVQAGIRTSDDFNQARIIGLEKGKILDLLEEDKIVILTGFQGYSSQGDITTLGRGGSDTSAVFIAGSIGGECRIYTDVEGIFTVDPKIRPKAKKMDRISYGETLEMASLGAKVIEARSVELAEKLKVPIHICLNTGEKEGTYILGMEEELNTGTIKNISKIDKVLLVTIKERKEKSFIKDITSCFFQLAEEDVNIDIINHSTDPEDHRVLSFTTNMKEVKKVARVLDSLNLNYALRSDMVKVSIIGAGMRDKRGIGARGFEVIAREKIDLYEVTSSEISISYVVREEDSLSLINHLADEFDL